MLLDMAAGIELEMRDALDVKLGQLAVDILQRALLFAPLSKDTDWFNDDENFAQVMASTLRLQHVLLQEVSKLASHMEKPEISFRFWTERADSRMLMIAGWILARSSQHEVTVDLRESNVTEQEAETLADMLQKIPKLTSIDLRGNPNLGSKGVAALAQALRDERPGHPRSLCGVCPSNTRLDVPRFFREDQDCEMRIIVSELENHLYSESVTAGMGGKGSGTVIQLNRRGGGGSAEKGWQPLIWAARVDHLQVAQALIDNGTRVNEQEHATSHSQKYSPLHMACFKGHVEMARLLLLNGADLSLKDVSGNVARAIAEKKGFHAIVQLLDSFRDEGARAIATSSTGGASSAPLASATPRDLATTSRNTPPLLSSTPRGVTAEANGPDEGPAVMQPTAVRARRGTVSELNTAAKRPAFGANRGGAGTPRAALEKVDPELEDVNGTPRRTPQVTPRGTPRTGSMPTSRPQTPSQGGTIAVE